MDGLPAGARAKIDATLEHLEGDPNWRGSPYVHALKGDGNGLIEIRAVFAGVQYRPLAFYGPGENEVTIVIGATERDDRLSPPSALETAQVRKEEVQNDQKRSCEHF